MYDKGTTPTSGTVVDPRIVHYNPNIVYSTFHFSLSLYNPNILHVVVSMFFSILPSCK